MGGRTKWKRRVLGQKQPMFPRMNTQILRCYRDITGQRMACTYDLLGEQSPKPAFR